jgi:molybdopterin-containing oxidoreductase family iron-sulfur binding subunit
VPACVEVCPVEARVFGDLNDANSPIQRVVKTPGVALLRPELGTSPRVFYVGLETEVG